MVLSISSMVTAPSTTLARIFNHLWLWLSRQVQALLSGLHGSFLPSVKLCESAWVSFKNFPSPFFCAPDKRGQHSSSQKWRDGKYGWINKAGPFGYPAVPWNLGRERKVWPRTVAHFGGGNYPKASMLLNLLCKEHFVHWFWATT